MFTVIIITAITIRFVRDCYYFHYSLVKVKIALGSLNKHVKNNKLTSMKSIKCLKVSVRPFGIISRDLSI